MFKFVIVIGAIATASPVNDNTIIINKPSGVVDGDLMIAQIVVENGDRVISAPAGWTQIQQSGGINAPRMASFRKIASSEGPDYAFSWPGGISHAIGGIVKVTGAQVEDTSSTKDNESSSTSAPATAITPTYTNGVMLFLVGNRSGSVSGYTIATNNPTWAELWDLNDVANAAMAWGSRPQTTATGVATATLSGSGPSTVQLIQLKEAPVITITDTTTLSDAILVNLGLTITDGLSLSDSITATVSTVWSKITKQITTWLYTDEND